MIELVCGFDYCLFQCHELKTKEKFFVELIISQINVGLVWFGLGRMRHGFIQINPKIKA